MLKGIAVEVNGIRRQIKNIFKHGSLSDISGFVLLIFWLFVSILVVMFPQIVQPLVTLVTSVISTTIAFITGITNSKAKESIIIKIAFAGYLLGILCSFFLSDLYRSAPTTRLYSMTNGITIIGFLFTLLFLFYDRLYYLSNIEDLED